MKEVPAPLPTILIAEPHQETALFLKKALEDAYGIRLVQNHHEVLAALKQEPQALILASDLSEVSGYNLCQHLRKNPSYKTLPILMLIPKMTVSTCIQALDHGADDALGKPFDFRELKARIDARLRLKNSILSSPKLIQLGALQINLDHHEIYLNQKKINLTPAEFEILRQLAEMPEQVHTRETLYRSLPGKSQSTSLSPEKYRIVDVHVRSLRKKLSPAWIQSQHGKGYRIRRS